MVAPHYNIQYSIYKLALKYLHDFTKSGDAWGKFRTTISQDIQNNNTNDKELFQEGDPATRQILRSDMDTSAGSIIPRHTAALNILEEEMRQVMKKDEKEGLGSCPHMRYVIGNENLVEIIEASISKKRELMRTYDDMTHTISLKDDNNEETARSLILDLGFLYDGHGGKRDKSPVKLSMYDQQYGLISINSSHADFMKAVIEKESQPHHLRRGQDAFSSRLTGF